ncbi:MAG: hypothetical protein HQK54_11395, partial [Oligoflexales bacterium]|nr:hypothetical protein [Oligoflexales bacterium]
MSMEKVLFPLLISILSVSCSCGDIASRYDRYELKGKLINNPQVSIAESIGSDGSSRILSGSFTGGFLKSARWSQLEGPSQMAFSSADQISTAFSAEADGIYSVLFTVRDILGSEYAASTNIVWKNNVQDPSVTPTLTPTPTADTTTTTNSDSGTITVEAGADVTA